MPHITEVTEENMHLLRVWKWYWPKKSTTERLGKHHSFEMDVINVLMELGYVKTRNGQPYEFDGKRCREAVWMNEVHHTDVIVTTYLEAPRHFHIKVNGTGYRAKELDNALLALEETVLVAEGTE